MLPRRAWKAEFLANEFLSGNGIEVGALDKPLRVPRAARVRYVDRMDVAGLRSQYPELQGRALIKVDVIDDGERLKSFSDGSQDFIIANHFIEHTQNPIGTIQRFMQVLKPGGCLYMAVPDQRWTFDRDRPVTPLEHLFRDYNEGPEWSRAAHYREYCEKVAKLSGADLEQRIGKLMQMDYSIHFHVWTQRELLEMLLEIRRRLSLPYELSAIVPNRKNLETICVLTRT